MKPYLRPMDAGEILDGAFSLCRRHPGAFLLAGTLPLVPLLALWGWMAADAFRGTPYGAAQADALLALALFGGWLPATLTRLAVVRMADDAQMGRPVHARAALREALGRLPAALWTGGITNLLIGLPLYGGLALLAGLAWTGMGAAYWMTSVLMWLTPAALAAPWFGALHAVVLEGAGGHRARMRSWTLTRAAPATVATVWGVTFLLAWVPWIATGAVLVATGAGLENGTQVVVWLGMCQAAGAVSVPLVAAARTLLFNDLRVRAEALDVRVVAERLAVAR
jgi:hypothetical protein